MRARAAAGVWPMSPRSWLAVALAGLAAAALVVHAGAPYLFKRGMLHGAVAAQLRSVTGLAIASRHARLDLLPRPRVVMSDVHVSDPTGALVLDAARMAGDVRLLPLVFGRVELAAVTLESPHLAVSLDGWPAAPDSTIGRAARRAAAVDRRLGSITFVNGTVSMTRGARPAAAPLTAVDATLDWSDLDAAATLVGSLRVDGLAVDLDVWVAQPMPLLRRDRSTVALRMRSAPLDLSATGELASGGTAGFKGRIVASAPSLAALAGLVRPGSALPAPFADASLDGSATLRVDPDGVPRLDLQKLAFEADGNAYEGTLAVVGGVRPLVSGTLAATQLSLAPFLSRAPSATDGAHGWSRAPLGPVRLGAADLDLRVSATRLRVASATIDDAALSVMTRGDRWEVELGQGRAYGGGVKGRVSIGADGDRVSLRAAGALTGADLAALSWDAVGRQAATGTLSASIALDATGDSLAALVGNAQGWLRAEARDGDVSGPGRDAASWSHGARIPFTTLTVAASVAKGTATLDEGGAEGPGFTTALAGTADLAARRLDLRARIRAPGATERQVAIGGSFEAVGLTRDGLPATGAPP